MPYIFRANAVTFMTYCHAIKVQDGLVFASDSRTNAGVDHVNTYSKMHTFMVADERLFVLLSAGNLATTQAVVNAIRRDLMAGDGRDNLNSVKYLFDAADYVGKLSADIQHEYRARAKSNDFNPEASFILGGQITGQAPELFLIYPQGNYIATSDGTPYVQIGETKYGKPILDRVIDTDTSLEDAARCALVSLDSTMRSNVSVGPPFELAIYRSDSLVIERHLELMPNKDLFAELKRSWNDGIRHAFDGLPRFDWEK